MARIIIASASDNGREQFSRLLASSGFQIFRCCASGGELRRALGETEDGIVLIVGALADCTPDELRWDYGEQVQILLIGRPATLEQCAAPDIFKLALPVAGQQVIGAVEMLDQLHRMKLPRRTGTDRNTVEKAKALLMRQLSVTEPEAHRIMQRYAMDHSIKMTEYAADLLRRNETAAKQGNDTEE